MNEYNDINTNIKSNQEYNNINTSFSNTEYNKDTCKIKNSKFSINKKLITFFISTIVFATVIVGVIYKHDKINILKHSISQNSYSYEIKNDLKNDKDLYIFITEKEDEKTFENNDFSNMKKIDNGINKNSFFNLKENTNYFIYIYSFLENNKIEENFLKSSFTTLKNNYNIKKEKEIININNIDLHFSYLKDFKGKIFGQYSTNINYDYDKENKNTVYLDKDNILSIKKLIPNTKYYIDIFIELEDKIEKILSFQYITKS